MMIAHGYIEPYAWYDAKQHPPSPKGTVAYNGKQANASLKVEEYQGGDAG